MPYTMEIYVDGGCRGNGQPGAIGAAAVAIKRKYGNYQCWTEALPSYPTPTNQRAEISAIILGLKQALEKDDELLSSPWLDVTIYSDSKFAVTCMTTWIYKWVNNGWTNFQGNEVANRDLIEEASDLDDALARKGDVRYVWIPREQNDIADRLCNQHMDEMCDDARSYSSFSSW